MDTTISTVHNLRKAKEQLGNLTYIAAAATLTLFQRFVELADGTYAVTLPPVLEAEGLDFAFQHPTGTNVVTLQDQDDSEDWSDKTIDAAADGIVVKSDGHKWWVIANDIS